jgi:hypothetical protein
MGAILPAPISGKLPGAAFAHSFLIETFQGICGRATVKSENRKLARRARGNGRRPVLLQTLSARDSDELATAFPRWGLRSRQLGRGPFRGHLQFLRLGGRKKRDSVNEEKEKGTSQMPCLIMYAVPFAVPFFAFFFASR